MHSNRLKEMCVDISMSIIEKAFHYEESELSVIKCKDEIWFRGKTVTEILRYTNQHKAIRDHVDPEDRARFNELYGGTDCSHLKSTPKSRGAQNGPPFKNEMDPLTNNQKSTIYINESGLYSLILHSKLESACAFKRWVTKDVLPSIRKTGRYSYDDMNHKCNDSLTFKIENETDLHTKVVSFLKKRYPHSIFSIGLGENQDSVNKRINSFKKGYLRGTPDLIVHNLNKHYTGLAIELKSPCEQGVLSTDQSKMLRQYQSNGFKTLVSNDYDHIIEQLIEYFRDVRILCSYCPRRFISSQLLKNHIKSFHKMA